MSGRFEGRHVLVAGGTSGIGRSVAEAFAREGAAVVATGLTEAEVQACRTWPFVVQQLDVTDRNEVAQLITALDRLDFLVNCAGTTVRLGREHEPEVFERVIGVNLVGAMRLCASCKPLLARHGGAVVNVASMLSYFGSPYVPGYSASKGGVVQLTKSLAVAWAADGVRVNAVAPGWIRTALTQPIQDDPVRSEAILARTPMKRWGLPEDVAGPVLFLCSPEAAFITGAVLPVDGGYLCC